MLEHCLRRSSARHSVPKEVSSTSNDTLHACHWRHRYSDDLRLESRSLSPFEIDRLTMATCKIFMYLNNNVHQSAAWLRVLLGADRLYTLNQVRQSRTKAWHRTVLLIIGVTLLIICLLNLHVPIFTCYRPANSSRIVPDSLYYSVYPMWNYMNLVVYNILPFVAILVFDLRIARQLVAVKSSATVKHSRLHHTSIAVLMFLSTFLFFATLIEFRTAFYRMMRCSPIRSLPFERQTSEPVQGKLSSDGDYQVWTNKERNNEESVTIRHSSFEFYLHEIENNSTKTDECSTIWISSFSLRLERRAAVQVL